MFVYSYVGKRLEGNEKELKGSFIWGEKFGTGIEGE
jgi:hypothetical protein